MKRVTLKLMNFFVCADFTELTDWFESHLACLSSVTETLSGQERSFNIFYIQLLLLHHRRRLPNRCTMLTLRSLLHRILASSEQNSIDQLFLALLVTIEHQYNQVNGGVRKHLGHLVQANKLEQYLYRKYLVNKEATNEGDDDGRSSCCWLQTQSMAKHWNTFFALLYSDLLLLERTRSSDQGKRVSLKIRAGHTELCYVINEWNMRGFFAFFLRFFSIFSFENFEFSLSLYKKEVLNQSDFLKSG